MTFKKVVSSLVFTLFFCNAFSSSKGKKDVQELKETLIKDQKKYESYFNKKTRYLKELLACCSRSEKESEDMKS